MNRLWLAIPLFPLCTLCTLCSATIAQTTTSPHSLYATNEGPGQTNALGIFAAGRFQYLEGNSRGTPMTIKAMAYRHDHTNYSTVNGMGRSWTSVQIRMSEGDLSTFGITFSANSATTPSLVFSNSIQWPFRLGAPKTVPSGFVLGFPFSTNWGYSGLQDILADYTFLGGTLSNAQSWSGTAAVPYHLDSFSVGSFASGPAVTFGNINGGCTDGAWGSSTVGASVHMRAETYAPNYPVPSLQNRFYVEGSGKNLGPSTFAMLILAFGADTGGIPVGIPCNNLYLDIRRTLFFHPVQTTSTGNIAAYNFGIPGGLAPYTIAWAGVNLVIQAAWNDTTRNTLKLTAASRNSLVAVPPFLSSTGVKMKTTYSYDPAFTTGPFFRSGDPAAIPIVQYSN